MVDDVTYNLTVEPSSTLTPIYFQVTSAVFNGPDETSLGTPASKIYLIIEAPLFHTQYSVMHIPDKIYYQLPADGWVNLKLLPTDDAYYKVSYYNRDYSKSPYLVQYWNVIAVSVSDFATIVRSTGTDTDAVSIANLYQLNQVNLNGQVYLPGIDYNFTYTNIQWISSNRPADGESYSLDYKPSLTLDVLLVQPGYYEKDTQLKQVYYTSY